MTEPEDLTPDERRALDQLRVAPAPDGFSARVLAAALDPPARVAETQPPSRARWRPLALGLAGAVAASAALGLWLGPEDVHSGRVQVEARRTLSIGPRAVAVAEAGADLELGGRGDHWSVHQRRGNVFYRVDPGAPFEISTPAGTVTVLGTCFRVEVRDMARSWKRDAVTATTGAVAGAVIASVVFVTVYEGRVAAQPTGAPSEVLAAGEAASMVARAPLDRTPARSRAIDLHPRPEAAVEEAGADEGRALPPEERVAQLTRRNVALEAEVATLRAELSDVRQKARGNGTYDLPPEELAAMAERCELRWDLPGVSRDHPPTFAKEDAQKLGLGEDERAVIDRIFAAHNQRMITELTQIYGQVTGEDGGTMSADAMFDEIGDKTPKAEVKATFQRLARERAGLQAPPTDATKVAPFERLYRLFTTAGDRITSDLAAELGPETARALRDLNEGWGSRSRSSHGCP